SGLAFPHNRVLLETDFRLLIFNQDTYGLGIRRQPAVSNGLPFAQPMNFNYLRLYGTAYRRLQGPLYAGAGIAIDRHFAIDDKAMAAADTLPGVFTYQQQHNLPNGMPLKAYANSGLTFSLRYDSRDNVANPYKGWFGAVQMRANMPWLGSQRSNTAWSFEGRYYLNLQKSRPRHLLAFWAKADFVNAAQVPYLALPAIGWDAYNRTGRGYVQGRIRGTAMLYAEAEYRYPISANGLLGGVLFTNITTAADGNNIGLAKSFAPAGGAGMRVKLDKKGRINICADYAFGIGGSRGLFFALQEAF
ncbi:MAG TPA: BamA/TamA family outer membrane protein, partial [Phnomibacter sp.]|nr:BamA/TamA family outer membrane protein [Phnomibacter sp.]